MEGKGKGLTNKDVGAVEEESDCSQVHDYESCLVTNSHPTPFHHPQSYPRVLYCEMLQGMELKMYMVTLDGRSEDVTSTLRLGQFHGTCPQGWILNISTMNVDVQNCYLMNPITLQKLFLPPLPSVSPRPSFFNFVLLPPPPHPNCTVVFSENDSASIFSCKLGDSEWKTYNWGEVEFLYALLAFKEELYGLTDRHSLLKLDVKTFTGVIVAELEPDCIVPVVAYFRFLVESCNGDEIFMVHHRKTEKDNLNSKFRVFRIDNSQRLWVEVNDIGNQAFFLCYDGVFSCPVGDQQPEGCGFLSNHIYFLESDDNRIFCYSFKEGSLSAVLPDRLSPSLPSRRPMWINFISQPV